MFAVLSAEVKTRGVCVKERTLPVAVLGYTPVDVPIEASGG